VELTVEPVTIEVLASRVREVPAASLTLGAVMFTPEGFTFMTIGRPDDQGLALVGSLMGPSLVGLAKTITDVDDEQVTWEAPTTTGPYRKRSAVPLARRTGRVLILLPEEEDRD
jgi:hypothetical protein